MTPTPAWRQVILHEFGFLGLIVTWDPLCDKSRDMFKYTGRTMFRNAVSPTETGLNKKINGTVGQTESHHARSSWNNHTIVVQQRRTGYTPSTDLGSDRPVDGPVSRVQGGEFTVGPPHKEEIGP